MDEKTLKVGILGTGSRAGTIAEAVAKMAHVEVCAVASRNMEDACTFALKYDIKKAYPKYDDLLKDAEVDLVYIAVPQSHHALYASACIDKKKPVLVEKCMAVNAEQAEALAAKAEHEGVFLAEALWTQHLPMVQTIREIARSGKIGQINAISANLGAALSKQQRILEPQLAGGALLELGVYPLLLILDIAGDDVRDISAEARKSRSGVDLEDHVFLNIKDGDEEIRCSFYTSVIGPTDGKAIVYGTEGYLVIEDVEHLRAVEVYDASQRCIERIARPVEEETDYVYQFAACQAALAAGERTCDGMEHSQSVKRMKILDLIRQGMGVAYPFE